MKTHEFDSSRTCNYCGVAAENVPGIAEQAVCLARDQSTLDFGPLPGIHPRHGPVQRAERELEEFLVGLTANHKLTRAEYRWLLSKAVERNLQSAIVVERRKEGP